MGNETLQITSLNPMIVKDDQWTIIVNESEDFPLGENLNKIVKIES